MKNLLLPILALGLLFGSCQDEKKEAKKISDTTEESTLGFAETGLTSKDFSACEGVTCPEIRVNYLKFRKNGEAAKAINKYNQKQIVRIFSNVEEDTEAKNITAALDEFIADYKNFKNDFPNSSIGYEIETSQNVIYQNKELLVLKTEFYIFTGGAHGYGATLYKNFNRKTGQVIKNKDLFSDLAKFKTFAEKEFRKKFKVPEDDNINSKGFFFEDDTFALPENIAITKDEVLLIYNQYEAASYAEGQLTLNFPKEQVSQWLDDIALN